MPSIHWLGRRWRAASDDYVFVSIIYFVILGAWGAVIVSQVYRSSAEQGTGQSALLLRQSAYPTVAAAVTHAPHIPPPALARHYIRRCPQASPSLANTYLGMGCVDLITALFSLITGVLSAQGSIFELSQRRFVPTMITVNMALMLTAFVLSCVCAALVVQEGVATICRSARRAAYLIYASLVLNFVMSVAYFGMMAMVYDPLGRRDFLTLEEYARTWQQRCHWICCQVCRRGGLEEEAYEDVSWVFASCLRGYDMVPSDIVAGLLLLHGYQQCARRTVSAQMRHLADVRTSRRGSYRDKVSTQAVPSRRPTLQQRAMIDELRRYCRFYMASYGWMLYEYNRCCAVPELLCCVDPLVCCREYPSEVCTEGSNLDLGVLFQITGIPEEDLIFANWKNKLFQPVFYVAYDRTTDAIIISIRGTMSFVDCLTDLVATPCALNMHESEAVNIDTPNCSLCEEARHDRLHSRPTEVSSSDEHATLHVLRGPAYRDKGGSSRISNTNSKSKHIHNNSYQDHDSVDNPSREADPSSHFRFYYSQNPRPLSRGNEYMNSANSSVHRDKANNSVSSQSQVFGRSMLPTAPEREREREFGGVEDGLAGACDSITTHCDAASSLPLPHTETRPAEHSVTQASAPSVIPPRPVPPSSNRARTSGTHPACQNMKNSSPTAEENSPTTYPHTSSSGATEKDETVCGGTGRWPPCSTPTPDGPCQVHGGMHRCAQFVLRCLEEQGILQHMIRGKYASKKVVLVGHSLGAGVAMILGIILCSHVPSLQSRLRVLAYAPPGAVLSQALVDYSSSFIMGCYCGYDMIPRLSQHTFDAFRELLFDAMAASCVPKSRIFLSLFRTADLVRRIHRSQDTLCREDATPMDCEATPVTGTRMIRTGSVESRNYRERLRHSLCNPMIETTRLYPCQTLIHFTKMVTRYHYYGCVLPWVRKREVIYVPVFETPQDVQTLIASPYMFSDHFPDKLYDILTDTHDRLGRGELDRYFVESTPNYSGNFMCGTNRDGPLPYKPL